jgi:hypothetical protein
MRPRKTNIWERIDFTPTQPSSPQDDLQAPTHHDRRLLECGPYIFTCQTRAWRYLNPLFEEHDAASKGHKSMIERGLNNS